METERNIKETKVKSKEILENRKGITIDTSEL